MNGKNHFPGIRPSLRIGLFVSVVMVISGILGCAMGPTKSQLSTFEKKYAPGTIIAGSTGKAISFEGLVEQLAGVSVVYIGENHRKTEHHDIQLKIIRALFKRHADLMVGMEMFAQPYQPVLDQWSAGALDKKNFLEKTQWYANWQFDLALYEPILNFLKQKGIPLIGLNLPFHIPPLISVGGIDNLLPEDRQQLPTQIDVTNEAHRKYVREIYQFHHLPGRDRFEYFYQAQCAWEDTMAEAVARYSAEAPLVVLTGNGHIIHKFGIPDRAFHRNRKPFKTVYLAAGDSPMDLSAGDYIWVTF